MTEQVSQTNILHSMLITKPTGHCIKINKNQQYLRQLSMDRQHRVTKTTLGDTLKKTKYF